MSQIQPDEPESIPPLDAPTPARTRGQGNPVLRRAQGAGPETQPGHDKAHAAKVALLPTVPCVPPAKARPKFSVDEFRMLRWYAELSFRSRIGDRARYEAAFPRVPARARLLDVADIVIMAIREAEAARSQVRRAAKKQARRRTGGER